jgi:hypothetical protein
MKSRLKIVRVVKLYTNPNGVVLELQSISRGRIKIPVFISFTEDLDPSAYEFVMEHIKEDTLNKATVSVSFLSAHLDDESKQSLIRGKFAIKEEIQRYMQDNV